MHHQDDIEHLLSCADCQASAGLDALDIDLERVWHGVAASVWGRPVGRVERLAGWLLRSPGLARALTTTPSLMLSWILASAGVIAIGVLLTEGSGDPWFALIAPALAGASVAYAYGPGIDPAFELAQSLAISSRSVLLVRIVAVIGVNALLGAIASLVTASTIGLTFGWLLPMVAISLLGLAGATLARSANTGVAVALSGWGLIVFASAYASSDLNAAIAWPGLVILYLVMVCGLLALALYGLGGRRIGVPQWR